MEDLQSDDNRHKLWARGPGLALVRQQRSLLPKMSCAHHDLLCAASWGFCLRAPQRAASGSLRSARSWLHSAP